MLRLSDALTPRRRPRVPAPSRGHTGHRPAGCTSHPQSVAAKQPGNPWPRQTDCGGKGKNSDIFAPKNGPDCAQPPSSAKIWGYHATASREKVRVEVRCVRSKPETAKQAPNRQAWPRGCAQTQHLKARSFDLEVTPWAPTRLTSCISHPGPAEAYERLRSTLCPARAPFRHLAAPESTRKPLLHTRGICRAISFDLEVTPWAPTRLTSCIFHPGPAKAYERLRSTLCPARAPFHHLAAPESTRKPPVRRSGISRARSFGLELQVPWPRRPL